MCCEKSIADELQTITGGQITVDVKNAFCPGEQWITTSLAPLLKPHLSYLITMMVIVAPLILGTA
jgi:hypothetical protein